MATKIKLAVQKSGRLLDDSIKLLKECGIKIDNGKGQPKAATVSFYRKDFAFPEFDTAVFYPHQFPSPQHEQLHASELYPPDGTFILTVNFFVRSVMEPKNYLQLGIYEFAKAYQLVYPGRRLPKMEWEAITKISKFTKQKLTEFIGLPEPDRSAIGLTLYFTHAEAFQRAFPEQYAVFGAALRPAP